MTTEPSLLPSFAATVDWLYAGLVRDRHADLGLDAENGLGGRFLYAGELHEAGSALVVAANIAGAASLTASVDIATQKQAIRSGVIDFLVNSLDEALRILKNEIRKRETVAVCVTRAPEDVEREMLELGVQPNLLPPGVLDALRFEDFIAQGARQVDPAAAGEGQTVLTWRVDEMPALWLPKLDTEARDCLASDKSAEAWAALRWLHLAPRYMGRLAGESHLLRCHTKAAQDFVDLVQKQVASGRLGVAVEVGLGGRGQTEVHRFLPPVSLEVR